MSLVPFNPLDKRNLAESIVDAMIRGTVVPLKDLERFVGAGIYALYYTGSFLAYEALAEANGNGCFVAPIYVGKAVPGGARKGGQLDAPHGEKLYKRLEEHRKSIVAAKNLDIDDFHFRSLVLDDIWIPLGETLLIAKTAPVWNNLLDGFGNHNPGKERESGMISRWDVLHPGRIRAVKYSPRPESAEQLGGEIGEYLENRKPFEDPSK